MRIVWAAPTLGTPMPYRFLDSVPAKTKGTDDLNLMRSPARPLVLFAARSVCLIIGALMTHS
jgi:hypothetical protein